MSCKVSKPVFQAFYLGRTRYIAALKLQEALAKWHQTKSTERLFSLLLLEHNPVYTIGFRSKMYSESEADRLKNLGADFVRTNRGGLITFHGPGQLVAYPIFNLQAAKLSVRCYVHKLEETIIKLCQRFGLEGTRSPHTGVWIGNSKICAMGINCQKGVASHGLALNCNTDLQWFANVVPCGLAGKGVTSLSQCLQRDVTVRDVIPEFRRCFGDEFGAEVSPVKEMEENLSWREMYRIITAEDNVNVLESKSVDQDIVKSSHTKNTSRFGFCENHQVNGTEPIFMCKPGGKDKDIDLQMLFQRMVIAANSLDEGVLKECLKFEFCAYPLALFESPYVMRKACKSTLANALWARTKSVTADAPYEVENAQYVIDGGALLHSIKWVPEFHTYDDICQKYCEYVAIRYKSAVIVFDGYESETPSTKSCSHARRRNGVNEVSQDFSADELCMMPKEQFFSFSKNKQKFIKLLGSYLTKRKCEVIYAPEEADSLVVETAVQSLKESNTIVIGDDTDLLVLLIHHVNQTSPYKLFFRPAPQNSFCSIKTWDVKLVKCQLGTEISQSILFLHAILGCDTTSRLFRIGKPEALNLFTQSKVFRNCASTFFSSTSSSVDVIESGSKAVALFYNADPEKTLDQLRYKEFRLKMSGKSKKCVELLDLPPTSAAVKYHSLRTYFQVQKWKSKDCALNAEDWGWTNTNGLLKPVMTDLKAAPQILLSI